MTRVRTVAAVVVSLLDALHPFGAVGRASNHEPPRARLVTGEHVQARRPYTTCWAPPGGDGGFCADGFPRYRRAIPGDGRERVRIRIRHPAEIGRVDLDGFRRLRDRGYWDEAYGGHRDFNVRVRPNRAGGEIRGWRIAFRLPEREGHLYLDLALEWPEYGDAFYALHVDIR